MEIEIPDKSLRKTIQDDRRRARVFGADTARKILIRMTAILAADSLADFWPPLKLPERCHELKGNLKGIFSMDLKHPFRLLFREADAEDRDSDQSELDRWKRIRTVEIIGIEDTHD